MDFQRTDVAGNRRAVKLNGAAAAFGNGNVRNAEERRALVFDRHRRVAGNRH